MQEEYLAKEPQFKCQRCGACCRLVGLSDVPEIKAMVREGSSECKHLQLDNLCAIYESRPSFCRVDKWYDQFIKQAYGITREEWYERNYKACAHLRNVLGIEKPQGVG